MMGRAFLYTGAALIAAAALRAVLSLLTFETFNIWSVILAVGCILSSIGLGLTKSKPWDKISAASKQIQKNATKKI